MLNIHLFDVLPLWAVFLVTAGMVLLSIEAGYLFGASRGKPTTEVREAPISSVIGSTLGLLGFLLAFTFGLAANRFETRRQLLLDEVNAIGTCYLRAGLLPEAPRLEIRKRLREYAHLRADVQKKTSDLPSIVARCEVLQDELWAVAETVAKKNGDNEVFPLYVSSLNDVIDFHTKRLVVGGYRIPSVIWLALYVISALAMTAVGYQFGRAGVRDFAISAILAIAFSLVIYLIADLDRVDHGNLQVSQRPMIELDSKLDDSPP